MQGNLSRLLAILMIAVFVLAGSTVPGQAKDAEPPQTPTVTAPAAPSWAGEASAPAADGRVLNVPGPRPGSQPAAAPNSAEVALPQASMAGGAGKPGVSFQLVRQFGRVPQPVPQAYPGDAQHLNHPNGLYVDQTDQLWVAEERGNRVLKARTDFPPIGAAGVSYTADNVLAHPMDMARDKDGFLWIADQTRVVQYDVSGASPVFKQNYPALEPWSTGSGNDRFNEAIGIAFDSLPDQHMFVGDYFNHRVQVFRFDAGGTLVYLNTIGDPAAPGNDDSHFQNPQRVAVDASNRVYFIDDGNSRVMRCSSPDSWASYTCAPLALAQNVTITWAHGLAISSTGDVYITDTAQHHILKCPAGDVPCAVWIGYPYILEDVAVDSRGSVYGSDWENQIIRQFDAGGAQISFYMGAYGIPYLTTAGYLNAPWGVATAPDGSIYITESEGLRLVKLDASGSQLWAVGTPGMPGPGNNAFGAGWAGLLGNPAVDAAGRVYVTDTSNRRVQIYNSDGTFFNRLGETGVEGIDNAHFSCVIGAAISPRNGDILVVDACNQRVQVFDQNRVYKATIGVTGEEGSDNNHFAWPYGVAADASGAVYVVDVNNTRVQKCTYTSGNNFACSTFFGELQHASADFAHGFPFSVAVDRAGRVYVGDLWNNRVLVLDSAGKYLASLGDGWGMNPASISNLGGVAVDARGSLYVTDRTDMRVLKFSYGVLGWQQVNLNGFGSPGNTHITAMASFGGALYAGTGNDGYLGDPRGGQIWRQVPGGDWQQVVSGGFGFAHNYAIDHLLAFNGYLYASTWAEGGAGGEIWRSPSGDPGSWAPVVTGGSDNGTPDPANSEFFHMFIDSGQICATTWSDTAVHGSEIWCSTDGSAWEAKAYGNGFEALMGGVRFGDYLYLGTVNMTSGADVFRTRDWSSWELAASNGLSDSSSRHYAATGLAVFKGYLYTAWAHAPGGSLTLTRCQQCGPSGGSTDDWQKVNLDPNGLGNVDNRVGPVLRVASDTLYVLVGNPNTGVQLWKSTDGLNWSSAAPNGFGLPYNMYTYWDHALLEDNGALYAGVYNFTQGGSVWKLIPNLNVPLIMR